MASPQDTMIGLRGSIQTRQRVVGDERRNKMPVIGQAYPRGTVPWHQNGDGDSVTNAIKERFATKQEVDRTILVCAMWSRVPFLREVAFLQPRCGFLDSGSFACASRTETAIRRDENRIPGINLVIINAGT